MEWAAGLRPLCVITLIGIAGTELNHLDGKSGGVIPKATDGEGRQNDLSSEQ
jgi:hypothetical protein